MQCSPVRTGGRKLVEEIAPNSHLNKSVGFVKFKLKIDLLITVFVIITIVNLCLSSRLSKVQKDLVITDQFNATKVTMQK